MNDKFTIKWIDAKREPQVAPDPAYPTGKDLVAAVPRLRQCRAVLPYPAKRCGIYSVKCKECGMTVACTTAGRPDDPRSITFNCKPGGDDGSLH